MAYCTGTRCCWPTFSFFYRYLAVTRPGIDCSGKLHPSLRKQRGVGKAERTGGE
jgi:hypothetical protein